MAVVVELYMGKDNIVRGCKLKTMSKGNKVSYINRPVIKLYPLEIVSEIPDNQREGFRGEPTKNSNSQSTDRTTPANHNIRPSTRPKSVAAEEGIRKRIHGNQN